MLRWVRCGTRTVEQTKQPLPVMRAWACEYRRRHRVADPVERIRKHHVGYKLRVGHPVCVVGRQLAGRPLQGRGEQPAEYDADVVLVRHTDEI